MRSPSYAGVGQQLQARQVGHAVAQLQLQRVGGHVGRAQAVQRWRRRCPRAGPAAMRAAARWSTAPAAHALLASTPRCRRVPSTLAQVQLSSASQLPTSPDTGRSMSKAATRPSPLSRPPLMPSSICWLFSAGSSLAAVDVAAAVGRHVGLDALAPAGVDHRARRRAWWLSGQPGRGEGLAVARGLACRRCARCRAQPRVAQAQPQRGLLVEGDGVAQVELGAAFVAVGVVVGQVGRRRA